MTYYTNDRLKRGSTVMMEFKHVAVRDALDLLFIPVLRDMVVAYCDVVTVMCKYEDNPPNLTMTLPGMLQFKYVTDNDCPYDMPEVHSKCVLNITYFIRSHLLSEYLMTDLCARAFNEGRHAKLYDRVVECCDLVKYKIAKELMEMIITQAHSGGS